MSNNYDWLPEGHLAYFIRARCKITSACLQSITSNIYTFYQKNAKVISLQSLITETNKLLSISKACPWRDSYGKSIILLQQNLFLQAFTILRLLNLQLTFNTVYLFLRSPARDRDYSLVFEYLFTWSCT